MTAPARSPRHDPPRMTVAEFLSAPLAPGRRWELIDGAPVSQASPHQVHGRLQSRLARALGQALDRRNARDGTRCEPVTEAGIRTRLDPEHNYRVADLAVTCEETGPAAPPWVEAPVLIVEILSPGQEREQRAKLHLFAALPTVREILFLDSRAVRAELHRRAADGGWPPAPALLAGEEAVLRLETAGLELPLARLYEGLGLEPDLEPDAADRADAD